MNSTHSRRKCQ